MSRHYQVSTSSRPYGPYHPNPPNCPPNQPHQFNSISAEEGSTAIHTQKCNPTWKLPGQRPGYIDEYIVLDSLSREISGDVKGRIKFNIRFQRRQSDSTSIGISSSLTDIVQLEIFPFHFPKEVFGNTYAYQENSITMNILEMSTQGFTSEFTRHHFDFKLTDMPKKWFLEPNNDVLNFTTPIQDVTSITLEFRTPTELADIPRVNFTGVSIREVTIASNILSLHVQASQPHNFVPGDVVHLTEYPDFPDWLRAYVDGSFKRFPVDAVISSTEFDLDMGVTLDTLAGFFAIPLSSPSDTKNTLYVPDRRIRIPMKVRSVTANITNGLVGVV